MLEKQFEYECFDLCLVQKIQIGWTPKIHACVEHFLIQEAEFSIVEQARVQYTGEQSHRQTNPRGKAKVEVLRQAESQKAVTLCISRNKSWNSFELAR